MNRAVTNYRARLLDRIGALDPKIGSQLRNMKLDWYRIRNQEDGNPDSDEIAEVFIYDEIGGSFGVSADEFVKDLQGITAPAIDVRINSPGGSVFDAISIMNALIKHPAHVTTYVDALAASAASIIAMAGDEVVMMPGSQMMIHDALGLEMGNAHDLREMADFLDRQSDNIANIYAGKGGGDTKQWRDLMLAETWLMGNEAVDFGLADRVYMPPSKSKNDPDEEMPHTEEIDEDDETEDDEDAVITALMNQRHRLTNRGFKYFGRNRAPDPNTVVKNLSRKTVDDGTVNAYVNTFRKALRK